MKKVVLWFCILAMTLVLAGCESDSEKAISKIKKYFTDNVNYTLEDIRVIDEGKDGFAVIYSIAEPYTYDDFSPFVKQLVDTQVNFEKEEDINISYVNPTLRTGNNSWIGWSNKSFIFYDQDSYAVEKVPYDKIDKAVNDYKIHIGISKPDTNESAQDSQLIQLQSSLYDYLKSADATTALTNFVQISDYGWITVYIEMESYDSYAFAAIISEATDYLKAHAESYGIEDYSLSVSSPTDAKYKARWISDDLKNGYLTDTSYNYNTKTSLAELKELYGYEGLIKDIS
jgi:hypothetical protein